MTFVRIILLAVLGLKTFFVSGNKVIENRIYNDPYPEKKIPIIQNVTLYLNYANNVFGPSIKMHVKNNSRNISQTVHFKGSAIKTPNLSEIRFGVNLTNMSFPTKKRKSYYTPKEQRSKRGVFDLYNMVSCATGCNPLIYKGYGCYCGFLGSGYAVDGIDRCCKMHDWCYVNAKCPLLFLEYIIPYFWNCYSNVPFCAIDHGGFGGPESCASKLCECDRLFSNCLSHYPCPSSRALCRSSPLRLLQNALMFVT